MAGLLFDLVRATLFARKAVKWGGRWLVLPLLGKPQDVHVFATYLRSFIEEMGVTFIKLGQYLALRLDILPPAVCAELNALFSDASPIDSSVVRRAVERELGRPFGDVFAEFEPRAIGSASIAQVHRATTHDGRRLALKVQRPNVAAELRADIRNLRRLGWFVDRLGLTGSLSAVALIDEIAEFSLRELDFVLEGHVAEEIGASLPVGVRAPRVHWDLTTPRLLAMEFIEGVSVLELVRLAERGEHPTAHLAPGGDPERFVDSLAEASLTQLFVTGLFHGDPHPANIVIERDGTVVFLDFGIFGVLSRDQRDVLRAYVQHLAMGNLEAAYHCYSALTEHGPETDRRAYQRDMVAVLGNWYRQSNDPTATVAEKLTAKFEGEVLEVMRRHGVRMHSNQLLFWRALALLDATAHRLPGRFDLLPVLRSFFRRIQPSPAARLLDAVAALVTAASSDQIPGFLLSHPQPLRVRHSRDHTDRGRQAALKLAVLVPLAISVMILFAGSWWLAELPRAWGSLP